MELEGLKVLGPSLCKSTSALIIVKDHLVVKLLYPASGGPRRFRCALPAKQNKVVHILTEREIHKILEGLCP